MVAEDKPTPENLLGTAGSALSDGSDAHLRVQASSILRADGGFLVLQARELLGASGALSALVGTLDAGRVEPAPARGARGARVRAEAGPVQVRVVVVGEQDVCEALGASEPAFGNFFKVLADLDDTLERGSEAARVYALFLARLATDESLIPFDRPAIAALTGQNAWTSMRCCNPRLTMSSQAAGDYQQRKKRRGHYATDHRRRDSLHDFRTCTRLHSWQQARQ